MQEVLIKNESEEVRNRQREYWKNKNLQFAGVKNKFLELFLKQNAADQPAEWKNEDIAIPGQVAATLLRVCNDSDLSLYILLLSLFKCAAGKYSGESLITTLSPVYQAGPGRTVKEYLVFQDKVTVADAIRENVQEIRKTVIGAYTNQAYFMADPLSDSYSNEEIEQMLRFNVLCVLENIHAAGNLLARFPMTILFHREGGNITGMVHYDASRIHGGLVETFSRNFSLFIENASRDFKQRIADIDILSAAERHQLMAFAKGWAAPVPDRLLHQLFEAQAGKTPGQIALVCGDEEITYQQLDALAGRAAGGLIARGVKPGDYVALLYTRGVEMVAALLAVLKAGAAFVPISPEEPAERIDYMLRETAARVLLTNQQALKTDFPGAVLTLDTLASAPGATLDGNAGVVIDHRSPAYVIFTSGTTGTPKGIIIEHRSIVNANAWRVREYGFSVADKALLLFAYNFDGFILNLFTPLLSGATVVLVSDAHAKDPRAIAGCLGRYGITHLTAVPALYHAILEHCSGEQVRALQRVTLAGDAAEQKTIRLSQELNDQLLLSNEYGPTENTVVSTYHRQMRAESVKVIGTPIDNVDAYVLDDQREPVPMGVFGELYLGNAGLAKGYLNNAGLTETMFVEWRGERLYRTGDLVRWLPEGTLEFKGRTNDQVKIRGFRVGLEEVRSCLLSHPAVREAVVVVLGEEADAVLCACVAARHETGEDALKAYVQGKLPAYMVPQQFVWFEALPVTESGKYDFTAIRAAAGQYGRQGEKELPRNEVEQKLLDIWKSILKVDHIGVNQNFFSLGGHSLKATALLSEIHCVFKVDLSLNQVFITNTIRGLAETIESFKGNRVENIPRIPKQDCYTLSSAQERLLALDAVENLGMSYNIPMLFAVEGHLDANRLEQALHVLCKRHEPLRTCFVIHNDQPMQVVAEHCRVTLTEKTIDDDQAIEEHVAGLLSAFDLQKAPLWQVTLLRTNQAKTYLLFDFHHIIIDETSLTIFFDELVDLYNRKSLPDIALSYKDYAAWQRQRQKSDEYKKQLDYWLHKLPASGLRPLNLPYDFRRTERITYGGNRVEKRIDPALFEAIRGLCQSQESTNFMFFLAAFNVLLHKYTTQKEIVVGSPVSERAHPETRNMLGIFLNTLPLLNTIDNDLSFTEFLRGVKNNVLADISNREVQFDDLVKVLHLERTLDVHPVFNVMIAIIDKDVSTLPFENAGATNLSYHNRTAKFDLMLEVHASEREITLYFEYSTGLFRETTISRLADCFVTLLENIVREPAAPLASLQMLSDAERQQLLHLGRANYNDATSNETLISLFEQQVQRRPDQVALVLEEETLTYQALNKKANQLARELKKWIAPEEIVAIYCGHSFEAFISILAVQKAGGAYLPLDIAYPRERIRNIVANSGTRLVLTDQANASAIAFAGTVINVRELDVSGHADTNLELICTPDSIAYVLYTSGTTGLPKGVLLQHKNTVNLITKASPYFSISSADVWTLFHSYCFDVSVWEMYGSLLNGCRLVIVPRRVAQDPKRLQSLVLEKGVTMLCLPPSGFYTLSKEMTDRVCATSLRYIILGGEAIKMYKLKDWYAHYPHVKLINGYGITETTVYSTYKEITDHEITNNIGSIGSPIPANYMYILDENRQVCPVGVLGEIYIGGRCLSRGYFNNQELTDKKFVPDPFVPGQKMYRTGDLARWLPNGEINYFSRVDHQVKVRGFRVELAEIESVMARYGTIRDVVVIGLDDEESGTRLVAYFTANQKEDVAQIRKHLEQYLSHYMIPAYMMQIEEIPLTTNGKVDRNKLPDPRAMLNQETVKRQATTPLQKLLRDIWADILGLSPEQISIDDKFFFIGGDSISATLIIRRLNNYNIDASIVDVFENNTIACFCEVIESRQTAKSQTTAANPAGELLEHWVAARQQDAEPLPKRGLPAKTGAAPKKVPVDLPVRTLLAVTGNQSNRVQVADLVLTGLGMAFRMWTGGERFHVTLREVVPGQGETDLAFGFQDTLRPCVLEVGDINRYRENLDAAIGSRAGTATYKLATRRVLADDSFRACLSDDALFAYYHGVRDGHAQAQSAGPDGWGEDLAALQEAMPGALSISCFHSGDEVQMEVAYREGAYPDKGVHLMLENFKFCLRQLIEYYHSNAIPETQQDQVVLQVATFNEVFFRDCTYQALIPAIQYFGRNFQLLFANCNAVYQLDEASRNVRFANKYLVDQTDDELFAALGIRVNKFFSVQDLCQDLVNYLSRGCLAVVQVDCYYMLSKKELYGKKHGPHSMLVYGYDKTRQLFHIIDNQSATSTNYQKNTIAFDALSTAYAGYNNHFNPNRANVSFYVISRQDERKGTEYDARTIRKIAIENVEKIADQLSRSKEVLDAVHENFVHLVSDEELLMANVSQLNHAVGEIVNARKIEHYKASRIYQDQALAELCREVVARYEYIRNVLVKMELSQAYTHGSARGMIEKLRESISLEKSYIAQLERLKSQGYV